MDNKNNIKNNSFNNETEEKFERIPDDAQVEVVGIRFKPSGKTYYFSPDGKKLSKGQNVIVKTSRGTEFGTVATENKTVLGVNIVQPLRSIERIATKEDISRHEFNKQLEISACETCVKLIAKHNLDMKLIEAEYTFDNSKLVFYFSSDGRVDFRELVKDLAGVFHTRIELRQIGIRDEAKMMGGIGVCGRPFCCSSFLSDFVQVSIKMAKAQNLSLNSSKISGTCGRLMCCLKYENDVYEKELANMPGVGSKVQCSDGTGFVTEISPLSGLCKVSVNDTVRTYHKDNLTVLSRMVESTDDNNDSLDIN